ncbi:MAG TPA: hypothetical protein VD793_01410 [Gemmatimonadales bacterium]|nr:hypothetical protein [Gemmatimonadales bacterium]
MFVDPSPHVDGRYGAALLFVRWTAAGDRPDGHLETDYLAFGLTPTAAREAVRALTLHDVKRELDAAIAAHAAEPAW